MTNTPLTSSEQSKVMIFVLLLLPTLFVVGIIPIIFLVFGIYMMKKNSDFSHIETASRNFRGYIYLVVTILSLFAVYFAITHFEKHDFEEDVWQLIACFSWIAVAIFYLLISHLLFLNPLQAHSEWVEQNGIFASKPKERNVDKSQTDFHIIGGEKSRSFSVADELLKWAKLKEDGHITEQEYNDARKKLLQST